MAEAGHQARRESLPKFLQPFTPYVMQESLLASLLGLLVGTIIVVAAVFGLFVTLAAINALERLGSLSESERLFVPLIAFLGAPVSYFVLNLGLRLQSRSAIVALRNTTQAPIVYLRSFKSDVRWFESPQDLLLMFLLPGRSESYERSLSKAVRGVGPLVAIGQPGEAIPPLGAARLYVQGDQWQKVVAELVAASQLVILRIGDTDGFWWEVEHIVATCDPRKVLFFLPPGDRSHKYALLRARAEKYFPYPLPEHPGEALFLGFSSEWQPQLYGRTGPSATAILRRVLVGSPAPAVREALNVALQLLGQKTRKMPLAFREWLLLSIPLWMIAFCAGMLVWIFYFE